MKSAEVRNSFLEFFRSKGHTIVKSDSLIPASDPTLLFTNAGMNQFKDVFLGLGKRNYTRVADSQKCIRVSGKHNDLEEVGYDGIHHTLFEMLGNWSFGDYYKREAIAFAWELLTEVWKISKEKLWATVYLDDNEAENLWYQMTDILKGRVLRFDEKENFWEMGDTGPCGPDSEIHIDLGPERCASKDPNHKCGVNSGCPRFVELWNLVFIQYNRDESGQLHTLKDKHVDTGMGFERVVSVLQNKSSNYDTDLFEPIIARIVEMSGHKYAEHQAGTPHRVIADHIRCLTFAIADGVMPSNKGRGYVIRGILRRAARYGREIGLDKPFLHQLVDSVIEVMGKAYSEIVERQEYVKKIILAEEERFQKTLGQGLYILESAMEKLKADGSDIIPGEVAFEMYDTYGFPIDLTRLIAQERDYRIDEDGFRKEMEAQRERGRASWQAAGATQTEIFSELLKELEATNFVGYSEVEVQTEVAAILKDGELVSVAFEGEEVGVSLKATPFYGEAGGQVGDTGFMESESARLEVIDTIKPIPDLILHQCRVKKGKLSQGDLVLAKIDVDRRKNIMLNHTATHILHSALRRVLGSHATQAGSLVAPDRLRFDFNHYEPLSKDQLGDIEKLANLRVRQNNRVDITSMPLEEAKDKGAMALFGEKYADIVRVVKLGDYSLELCGGTHLKATGEVGLFKIISEGSIAAGIRRIEALTGEAAYEHQLQQVNEFTKIAAFLKAKPDEVFDRVEKLSQYNRQLERQATQLQAKLMSSEIDQLASKVKIIDGIRLVVSNLEGAEANLMRSALDSLKAKLKSGVIVLGSASEQRVTFSIGVTPDLIESYSLKAGEIAKEVAKIVGGSGGGRADMAQAGGKDVSKLNEALESVSKIISAQRKEQKK